MKEDPTHAWMLARWKAIRQISCGADVSLLSNQNGFAASMQCAEKVFAVIGERLATCKEVCDGLLWSAPVVVIPMNKMQMALRSLSEKMSVALIDDHTTETQTARVCFYVVPKNTVYHTPVENLMVHPPADNFDSLLD